MRMHDVSARWLSNPKSVVPFRRHAVDQSEVIWARSIFSGGPISDRPRKGKASRRERKTEEAQEERKGKMTEEEKKEEREQGRRRMKKRNRRSTNRGTAVRPLRHTGA